MSFLMQTLRHGLIRCNYSTSSGVTVVYGLGNSHLPDTKHNLGQRVLEPLARLAADGRQCSWSQDKLLEGSTITVRRPSVDDSPAQEIVFIKSKHAMNLSGKTARQIVKRWPSILADGRFLVIHDYLHKEPVTCTAKSGGSAEGHGGLKDIVAKLGTQEFERFKIGIGKPATAEDPRLQRLSIPDWVLGQCGRDELEACDDNGVIALAAWNWLRTILYPVSNVKQIKRRVIPQRG